MIEQAMIFVLGFLVASLLSLMFVPVLSRRALRLATARLQMLVPLSPAEIVAERDQMRAEHAAATRRLEQKLEAVTQAKAELMGRDGRQTTRLVKLEHDHDGALTRIAGLDADLARTTRDANEARAELGLQMQLLYDTLEIAENRMAQLRATEARLAATLARTDKDRASIAGLETRATGQDMRIRTLSSQLASASVEAKGVRNTIETLTLERDAARADFALLKRQHDEASTLRDATLGLSDGIASPGSAEGLRAAISRLTDDLLRFVEPAAVGDTAALRVVQDASAMADAAAEETTSASV